MKPIVVQIGHQERVILKTIGIDNLPEKPRRIISQRLTAPSERGRDVSVSLDLMIHDLDLNTNVNARRARVCNS